MRQVTVARRLGYEIEQQGGALAELVGYTSSQTAQRYIDVTDEQGGRVVLKTWGWRKFVI